MEPVSGERILVFVDDRWHPGEVPREGLEGLGEFDWVEDGREWDAERLGDYSTVILAKANQASGEDWEAWLDEEGGKRFADWVEKGGRLVVVHSGSSRYLEVPSMRGLMGGGFDFHPEQCLVELLPVEGHPLCREVDAFSVKDEHYFMTFDGVEAEVFLHSCSEHGKQPAGWLREVGKGKVILLTPGHNPEVWLEPGFRKLLENAFRY